MARKPKDIEIANKLEALLDEIEARKAEIEPLLAEEKELRAELVEVMEKAGRKSSRTDSGLAFVVAQRKSITPIEGKEQDFHNWCAENNCLKPDSAKATKLLKREIHLPHFVQEIVTKYLSIKTSESDEAELTKPVE